MMSWESSAVGRKGSKRDPQQKTWMEAATITHHMLSSAPLPPQQCWHPRNLPDCCLLLFPFYLYCRLLFQETCLELGLLLSPEPSSGMRYKRRVPPILAQVP